MTDPRGTKPPPPTYDQAPVADSPKYQAKSWQELGAWWPYPPVLQPTPPPGTTEHSYSWSQSGTAADPKTEHATVVAVYERPTATVQSHRVVDIVNAGGYALVQVPRRLWDTHYRPQGETRRVDVGRATADEWYVQRTAVESLRFTQWIEGESGLVVMTSREKTSDADVRAFVASFRAIP